MTKFDLIGCRSIETCFRDIGVAIVPSLTSDHYSGGTDMGYVIKTIHIRLTTYNIISQHNDIGVVPLVNVTEQRSQASLFQQLLSSEPKARLTEWGS